MQYSLSELCEKFGRSRWFWRYQIWRKRLPVVRMCVDSRDLDIFINKYNAAILKSACLFDLLDDAHYSLIRPKHKEKNNYVISDKSA